MSLPRGNLSRWSLALSLPLAAALLYWSARGVDWAQVWQAMAHAHAAWLWGAAALTTVSLCVRAVRWRILLNAEARLSFGTVFRCNAVGYLGNNFLPARAGEVLRSVLISGASELSNSYVLTTALGERLMDVIAVILAAALALLWVNPKPAWMTDLSRSMAAVAVAGALAIVILPHSGTLVDRLIARLPLSDRVRKFLLHTSGQVLLGLRAFHDWGRLAAFAGLTAVVWSLDAVTVLAGARALDVRIPLPGAFLLLTAMALGSALPSTPGYIGIYQFAAVMVLGPLGVSHDRALAYSVVAQAVSYVVITAVGLPALYASRRKSPRTRAVTMSP